MTRYLVGPWPAGTQRSVVCKTLAAWVDSCGLATGRWSGGVVHGGKFKRWVAPQHSRGHSFEVAASREMLRPPESEQDDPWAAFLRKRMSDRPAIVNEVTQKVLGQLQERPASLSTAQFQTMAFSL